MIAKILKRDFFQIIHANTNKATAAPAASQYHNKQENIRQSHASHLLSCFIEIPYQNLLLCKAEGRYALMDQSAVASFDIYLPHPKYIFQ